MRIVKPSWIKHANKGTDLSIFSIDIHPDGTKVATGGQGNDCGRVAIWNMHPIVSTKDDLNEHVPKLLSQIDSHLQCVNAVRWSNSGNLLASAGDDQLIMIWTLSGKHHGPGPTEQYRTVSTLRSHSGDILDLSWSNEDQWLASCSVDNMVVIWNAQRWPEIVTILKGHTSLVKGVTWDPIGKYLASQSDDKTLRVWRVSDWSEEVVIKEPFEQCGGTTHVLRLSWSPDGQYIVSAQAMNNCGSVAKIIERQDWSARNDFVGHRKAIPCVRFNPKIFKSLTPGKKSEPKESKPKRQCVVAIGSRDRSISIWATAWSRPLIVVNDIFENSVLDFSWSRNGYQLMACSSDGSVAFLEFTEKELGPINSEEERFQYLQQLYGSSIGNKSAIINNLVEDIMILNNPKQSTNGISLNDTGGDHSASINADSNSSSIVSNSKGTLSSPNKQGMHLPKGPTDKQIEIRSADGRRRIIPLFIPPINDPSASSASTATVPISAAAISQPKSFSSSSESKSKIVIETRDESNPPTEYMPYFNNTKLANGTSNGTSKEDDFISGKLNNGDRNELNGLRTSYQPDTIMNDVQSTNKQQPKTVTTNGTQNNKPGTSSESSNDEIIIRRQKPLSKRKSIDNANAPPTVKRKPGRPPGSSSSQSKQAGDAIPSKNIPSETAPSQVKPISVVPEANANQIALSCSSSSAHQPNVHPRGNFFPPLKLSKQTSHRLFSNADKIYSANVEHPLSQSSFCKLSLCIDGQPSWNILLSSSICTMTANEHILVCACEDRTLNVFNTKTGGRIYVPIMLESQVARMVCANKSHLIVIFCNAQLWLWDVLIPKVLIKGESLKSLLINPKTSEQLSILSTTVTPRGDPIVAVSSGRTYIFQNELSSWCLVADTNDPLNACTDLKPSSIKALRNVSFNPKIPSRSLLNFFSSNTPTAQHGSISFIEKQIEASKVLSSAKDYRYWTLTLVQNLVSLHSSGFNVDNIEIRLRELCNFLLGQQFPKAWSDSTPSSIASTPLNPSKRPQPAQMNGTTPNKVMGMSKHDLLREVLSLLAANLSLQRLYIEFKEQLDSFSQNSHNSTYYLNSTRVQSQTGEAKSLNCTE